jgi:molybdate transport system substrate-binding protein
MRLLYALAALLLLPLTGNAQGAANEVTVFAAASLTDAMKDISAKWVEAGHSALRMSFGSSSTLARQIEQGAPANMFASADEKWMDYLADKKMIATDTRKDLLGNDLVLVVSADKPAHVTISKSFDMMALLGANGRLATGDPAHVPVGIYAEQALKNLGMWDSVSPRLARTDDVRAALLLVERGEAPAGIVYATDAAVSKAVMIAGTFPAGSHDPVSYPFAVTTSGDTAEARALLVFLTTPPARAVFVQRGLKVE